MTDSEKLKKIIDHYNISVSAFSKRIGLNSPQVLYDVMRERNGISKDIAEKITANCDEINNVWLLTGEGQMLNPKNQNDMGKDELIEEFKKHLEDNRRTFKILGKELEEKRENNIRLQKEVEALKSSLVMLKEQIKKKELVL